MVGSTNVMKPLQFCDFPTEPPLQNSTNRNNVCNRQLNVKRKNKYDRGGLRKRSKSFSGCIVPLGPKPVPPTKFLLGGNINDPLNLNSLKDEKVNKAMNEVTPKSSPVPTPPRRKLPIEVILPPNTQDPLHLLDCENDEEYEEHLSSPIKKTRKRRFKKRRTISSSTDIGDVDTNGNPVVIKKDKENVVKESGDKPVEEVQPETVEKDNQSDKVPVSRNLSIDLGNDKKEKNKKRFEENNNPAKKFKQTKENKIVSPVVPQPGAWIKRPNTSKAPLRRHNKSANHKIPTFKDVNKKFQYGNYDKYYGYRNPNNETDHRLKVFSHHPSLFQNKDILDVGCNIGHITLSIARDLGAKSVTGVDIDPKLIHIARKNIKHYVLNIENVPQTSEGISDARSTYAAEELNSSEFFPISLPILYGAIDIPGFHETNYGRGFPNNVIFKQCNYVPENESLLALEQPQFDVILCLSVTKWIQLNWGDNGLKLAFRRMYEQLRPGGKLILEPQHWASYKKKKNLTENIYKNYQSIEFFPHKYTEFLLSSTVGFAKSEMLGFPYHRHLGFRRPLQIFTKSTMFPSERVEPSTPMHSGLSQKSNDKCESQMTTNETVKHVYTNLYQAVKTDENEPISRVLPNVTEEGKSTDSKSDEQPATDNISVESLNNENSNAIITASNLIVDNT